jgi:Zn-dependent protease
MWFLQNGMTMDVVLMTILALLVTIFVILPIHEWAHGFIAYKLGDKTAKYSGRLTLNPLKHIDPLGAASMILFRFGWAKPVPVDARNFKNPKVGLALTALAGPMSNLIVAIISALTLNGLFNFYDAMPGDIFVYIVTFMLTFIRLNVGLAVFNLLPLPPLDGSRILGAFLPDKLLYKYYQYERYIMFAVFFLLFTNVLSVPLNYLSGLVFNGMMLLAGFN